MNDEQAPGGYADLPPPVQVSLYTFSEQACPYLPGRASQSRGLYVERLPGDVYHAFMNAGFRRSGKLIYQPVCHGCFGCQSLRVMVDAFSPSKSQRRCLRRNADLAVTMAPPIADDEKFDLYNRYVAQWHGRQSQTEDREGFESFLYDSPVQSVEFCYRSQGRLIAVGICDISTQSLSSVYFYFDPDESKRGLGTFGALREIAAAKRLGIPHYYLGYWVKGCGSMEYKAAFRPAEILGRDGVWREQVRSGPDHLPGPSK